MGKITKPICSSCGSQHIVINCATVWDARYQSYVIMDELDTLCTECNETTEPKWTLQLPQEHREMLIALAQWYKHPYSFLEEEWCAVVDVSDLEYHVIQQIHKATELRCLAFFNDESVWIGGMVKDMNGDVHEVDQTQLSWPFSKETLDELIDTVKEKQMQTESQIKMHDLEIEPPIINICSLEKLLNTKNYEIIYKLYDILEHVDHQLVEDLYELIEGELCKK